MRVYIRRVGGKRSMAMSDAVMRKKLVRNKFRFQLVAICDQLNCADEGMDDRTYVSCKCSLRPCCSICEKITFCFLASSFNHEGRVKFLHPHKKGMS